LEATKNVPHSKGKSNLVTHNDIDVIVESAMAKRNDQFKMEIKIEIKMEIQQDLEHFRTKLIMEVDAREERISKTLKDAMQIQMEEVKKRLALAMQGVDSLYSTVQPQLEY